MSWRNYDSLSAASAALALGVTPHGEPIACLFVSLARGDAAAFERITEVVVEARHANVRMHERDVVHDLDGEEEDLLHAPSMAAWACVALVDDADAPTRYLVWGYVPMAALVYHHGSVARSAALPHPVARRWELTAPYLDIMRCDERRGTIHFDNTLLPPLMHADMIEIALARRLGWATPRSDTGGVDSIEGATDAQLGALGYIMSLVATTYDVTLYDHNARDSVTVDWMANEEAHLVHSLIWHGGQSRLLALTLDGTSNGDGTGDEHDDRGTMSCDVELALHMLPVWSDARQAEWMSCFVHLERGQVRAPAAAWTRQLAHGTKRRPTAVVLPEHRSATSEWAKVPNKNAYIDMPTRIRKDVWMMRKYMRSTPRGWLNQKRSWFVELMHRALRTLQARNNARLKGEARVPGTGLGGTSSSDVFTSLADAVHAMPACMVRMHARATVAHSDGGHLKFNERQAYANFMVRVGVRSHQLVSIQEEATMTQFGADAGRKRMANEVRQMAVWTEGVFQSSVAYNEAHASGELKDVGGTSCRAIMDIRSGVRNTCACPFFHAHAQGTQKAQNVAMSQCSRAQGDLLREVSTRPRGRPVFYAVEMREKMNAQRVAAAAIAAAASTPRPFWHTPVPPPA